MEADDLLSYAEARLAARDLPAARNALTRAHAAGADLNRVAGALWELEMLAGNFEQAWRQSDALRRRNAPDPHCFWSGEPISGKRVIVRCLHGLGDAVMILRYAPLLRAQASEVIFEVPPRLLPLAQSFIGIDHVITWGESAPASPPAWDVQVEVMELPYLFRTTLADLPIATEYLKLDGKQDLGRRTKPRVGIVWSAGDWNPSRSIPVPMLEPLLRNPGIEFWNLQGKGNAEEAAYLPLRPLPEDGVLPLARTIAALDLVITVDTLAAHLAGALGRPAWVLLQHAADWRWLDSRRDSPWYPSLELFRQPKPGDWTAVIKRVQQRLDTLMTA